MQSDGEGRREAAHESLDVEVEAHGVVDDDVFDPKGGQHGGQGCDVGPCIADAGTHCMPIDPDLDQNPATHSTGGPKDDRHHVWVQLELMRNIPFERHVHAATEAVRHVDVAGRTTSGQESEHRRDSVRRGRVCFDIPSDV